MWNSSGGRTGRGRRSRWRGGGFGVFGREERMLDPPSHYCCPTDTLEISNWKRLGDFGSGRQIYTCVAGRQFCSQPGPSRSPQSSQSHPYPRKTAASRHDRSIGCDSFLCDDACAMRCRLCCCGLRWGLRKGAAGVEHGLRRGLGRGEESWGG